MQIPNTALSSISALSTPAKVVFGNSSSGTVTIGANWDLSAYSFPVEVYGSSIATESITAGANRLLLRANTGNITLSSGAALSSTAAGDAMILAAAGNFINNSGSATPITVTGGGRYLVYSTSPLLDTLGTPAITRPNKRYNFSYGASTAGLFSGASGFLYSVAPSISVAADAGQTKTYGAVNPTLTYSLSGNIDSDTGLLTGALTTAALQYSNVGTFAISQGTLSLSAAATALGYTFSGYTPDNLSITPAVISLSGSRVYDGLTSFANIDFGSSGTINTGINGETLVVSGSGSVPLSTVVAGTQTLTLGTLALGDGTGLASNYTLIIESADPGYDWVFNFSLAGLVTKYGGSNSHMTIHPPPTLLSTAYACDHSASWVPSYPAVASRTMYACLH